MHAAWIVTLSLIASTRASEVPNNAKRQWWEHDGEDEHIDVIVIGGGSSGTYTAIRLLQKNYSVALIERQGRLGGHVETYIVPGANIPIDYGVQAFDASKEVVDYFTYLGIPVGQEPASNFTSILADFSTGKPISPQQLPAAFVQNPAPAFETYAGFFAKYPYIYEGTGFAGLPDPVPAELLQPLGEVIAKYNIGPVAWPLWLYGQGIGNFLQLPFLYALKSGSAGVVSGITQGTFLVNELHDNQLLYNSAQAKLGPNVYVGATVTDVDRQEWGVSVTFDSPEGRKTITADQLVVAIPPIVDNLRPWLDLDWEESSIFGEFFYERYWAGVLYNSGLPATSNLANVNLSSPYGVPDVTPGTYVFEATGIPNYHSVYYHSSYAQPLSDAQVQSAILADLAGPAKALGLKGAPEFVAFKSHAPFAVKVSAQQIANGFYKRLTGLQGQRRTWWNGAAWETEDSSAIWQFTENVLLPGIAAELNRTWWH